MWQPCLKFVEGSPRRRCTWLGSQAGVAHARVAVTAPAVRRARARRRWGPRCPVPQCLPDWRSASFLPSLPPFRLASCLVGTITRSHRLVFLPSVSFLGRLLYIFTVALYLNHGSNPHLVVPESPTASVATKHLPSLLAGVGSRPPPACSLPQAPPPLCLCAHLSVCGGLSTFLSRGASQPCSPPIDCRLLWDGSPLSLDVSPSASP